MSRENGNTHTLDQIAAMFVAESGGQEWRPNDRIRTTNTSPIIRYKSATRERFLSRARWGLIPFWAKDAREGSKSVNARSETVHEKPTFKQAFQQRRCLVPSDRWIEWSEDFITGTKRKQPYRFTLPKGDGSGDARPFCFAGLWSEWTDPETGEVLLSYCILTTDSVGEIAKIHDRQPLILPTREAEEAWLNPDATLEELRAMLKPYDGPVIVSKAMLRDLERRAQPGPEKPKGPKPPPPPWNIRPAPILMAVNAASAVVHVAASREVSLTASAAMRCGFRRKNDRSE